jgi:hypothetical protein
MLTNSPFYLMAADVESSLFQTSMSAGKFMILALLRVPTRQSPFTHMDFTHEEEEYISKFNKVLE